MITTDTHKVSTTFRSGTKPSAENYNISQIFDGKHKKEKGLSLSVQASPSVFVKRTTSKHELTGRKGRVCSLLGTNGCRYSHPIASANCTVRIWVFVSSTVHHLAARGHNGGLVLDCRVSRSNVSVGNAAGAFILFLAVTSVSSGLSNSLGVLLVLVDGPVKYVVVLERLADKEISEDLAEVGVVWLVVKTKRTGVVQVDGKLVGESTAENLGWSGHLLFHDTVVLLLLGSGLESLPWQRSTAEVEHDVSEGFHVVTAGLFDTQVGVDTGITGSTSQVLVLTVRDVEVSLWITVLLGQTKIDDVDLVTTLSNAHKEVVWFDITVDEGLCVDVLDTRDELVSEQENGL